jgi:hypothetical protein
MSFETNGSGDEKSISEMSDAELMRERNKWNTLLEQHFWTSSGQYDITATLVKEIENEINRREHQGPPWLHE